MKFKLAQDNTIEIDLPSLASNLNRLAPSLSFSVVTKPIDIPGLSVVAPRSYGEVRRRHPKIDDDCDRALIFTEKPYDNNYFWDAGGGKTIVVSLSSWEHLTSIPRNNGAAYFTCAIAVRDLDVGHSHKEANTGCINDFWRDKTGVDIGMRSAFICPQCIDDVNHSKPRTLHRKMEGIQAILNDISAASRAKVDICDYWRHHGRADQFDVFMCHNSDDKAAILTIDKDLKQFGIRTWLDEEQLPPGRAWQDHLEKQIETIKTAAVFVGASGMGPWQEAEVRAFLQEFIRRQCPVIPVILSGCGKVPQLPLFLRQIMWVDFRKKAPDPMKQLLWGITGHRPN